MRRDGIWRIAFGGKQLARARTVEADDDRFRFAQAFIDVDQRVLARAKQVVLKS